MSGSGAEAGPSAHPGAVRGVYPLIFYAYGVGGTDRYPPFTLGESPGYPAGLWIDYPTAQRHGAGLAFAWVAGLPQYYVAAILLGAGGILDWPVCRGRGGGHRPDRAVGVGRVGCAAGPRRIPGVDV